ncbi:hypothetical protein G9A89_014287 [Geosiphon pyriformis]|nr:hypothetical protein G9A89_014287 [Geosiphon pyriformis]
MNVALKAIISFSINSNAPAHHQEIDQNELIPLSKKKIVFYSKAMHYIRKLSGLTTKDKKKPQSVTKAQPRKN